jgi:hypothetical protein
MVKKKKKRSSAKKKKTARKSVRRRAPGAARKRSPSQQPSLARLAVALHARAVATVRSAMLEIIAAATRHSTADVDGPPLSDWICDAGLCNDIAAKINREWPELDPECKAAEVKCSQTVDDLTAVVNSRLA